MFEKQKENGFTEVVKGVGIKTLVYGDKTLMVEVHFEKGAHLPLHSHPHEQTGFLISGQMEFQVEGEKHIAKPGDSWNIAGDVEHSATGLEQSVVIEVFSPVREEYLAYFSQAD